MRKLIVTINSTANDIVTGSPSGDETDLYWGQAGLKDEGLLATYYKSLAEVDTILLGHGTYKDLVRKWPKVKEWPDNPEVILNIGEKINSTPKVVVTGQPSLENLGWGEFEPPAVLSSASGSVEEQIKQLKVGDGGDIVTIGSPTLVQFLINSMLVDEYRVTIYPVIVNEGRRLFENLKGQTNFRLIGATSFESGALLIAYAQSR